MVSALSQEDVAAISYGGKYIFVLTLAILGLANGGAVVITQFWGAKDRRGSTIAFANTLLFCLLAGMALFFVSLIAAQPLATFASKDPAVVSLITQYIKITAAMILPFSVAFCISAGLRSIGRARDATRFALAGFSLNVLLNYILIFGNLGFESYGVVGAAIASFVSYLLEALGLVVFLFVREIAIKPKLDDLFALSSMALRNQILRISLPISISSVIWAIGLFVYTMLVSQMGTTELAMLGYVSPIESLAIALFIGMSSATAVIVGHSLGENKLAQAELQSKGLMVITLIIGVSAAILIYLSRGVVTMLFLDGFVNQQQLLANTLSFLSLAVIVRSLNVTLIVGILRAGGDTRCAIWIDLISQWLVAIPLTYISIFWLQMSFPLVFLAINSEEMFKLLLASMRYQKKIWCKNLTK